MRRLRSLARSTHGVAMVEMALVLPMLLALLCGIVSYGGWFFVAHSVQLTASNAARAGLAGIDAAERAALAREAAMTDLSRTGTLKPAKAAVAILDDGRALTVSVSYDASSYPLIGLGLLPLPSTQIVRRAAVRIDAW